MSRRQRDAAGGGEGPLVIAGGVLTGTGFPGTARYSVVGRSPLTGLFREAEAGDPRARVLAIGPTWERGVRFAAVVRARGPARRPAA